MSALWMECSSSAPPPDVRAIGAPRAVPGHDVARRPVLVVPQDVAHRASELAAEHDGSQLVDHRDGIASGSPTCAVVPAPATSAHISRTVAKSVASGFSHSRGFPAASVAAHEIEMGRRRGDDGDRVDVGIVDHRVRIRADRFERADALRGSHGVFGEVGGRHRTDLAVFGEQAQCVGVALSDHAAADEADPDGFLAERRSHAADRVRKTTMRCASVRTASVVVVAPVSARTRRRRRCRRGPPSPHGQCEGLRERSHAANGSNRQHIRVTGPRNDPRASRSREDRRFRGTARGCCAQPHARPSQTETRKRCAMALHISLTDLAREQNTN